MYTRRVDKGETDSGRGERLGKDSLQVELEGTNDELNSFIGLARAKVSWNDMKEDLAKIQRDIFTMGEHILKAGTGRSLNEGDTKWLEERVEYYRREVGPIHLFVIQGGSEGAAYLHVARTVCRRYERMVISGKELLGIGPDVLSYANRLSSVLFMMAVAAKKRMSVKEEIWDIRPPSKAK